MNSADSNYQIHANTQRGILTLRVRNWEKYNPRHDRENLSWFKMSTGFFVDHEVALLTMTAKYVLIYCLTEQGKSGSKPFKLNPHFAASLISIKSVDFTKAIQELQIAGFVELRVASATIDNLEPQSQVPVVPGGCSEERREEKTNMSGKPDVVESQVQETESLIEEIWNAFPKRDGDNPKKPCIEKLRKLDAKKLLMVLVGVRNFAANVKAKPPEHRRMIPMFQTWLNQERWESWQGMPLEKSEFKIWDGESQKWVVVDPNAQNLPGQP